jgi:flavin reductase (DIM6/NTAB) family NADH-FMN oxidoreductase RutF
MEDDMGTQARDAEEAFRHTVGHFATGVVVLTSFDRGQQVGMTVQSFTSVSLQPLLVSLSVSHGSSTWARIRAGGEVCINILAFDQEPVSRRFAQPLADRFEGVPWTVNAHGLPVLDSVLAWVDCEIDRTYVAGDHEVALCAVRDLAVVRAAEPLLFFRGAYSSISSSSPASSDSFEGLLPAW